MGNEDVMPHTDTTVTTNSVIKKEIGNELEPLDVTNVPQKGMNCTI